MDIKVKAVLDFIQAQKGHEHAVIAGGSVRDYKFDLEPRDYDFFVPTSRENNHRNLLEAVRKEFGIEQEPKEKGVEYPMSRLSGVNEIVFEGKVIDIVGSPYPNDEEFGSKIISDFDFGMNMVLYNGLYIDETSPEFQNDFSHYKMTLINLESISHLPNAIKRFNNFNEKLRTVGISLRFEAPDLKWSKPVKKEKPDPYIKYSKYLVGDGLNQFQVAQDDLVRFVNMGAARRDVRALNLQEGQVINNPAGEIRLDRNPIIPRPWDIGDVVQARNNAVRQEEAVDNDPNIWLQEPDFG